MGGEMKVTLARHKETLHTEAARARVEALAQGAGQPAYVVVQSFEKIRFEKWSGVWPVAFDLVFAGRIFGPDAEIRWIREGDSCTIWKIHEAAGGETYERELEARRYYLWGVSKAGKFAEERVAGQLDYPVAAAADGDRAYIEVFEYYHAKPEAWPDPKSAEQALNRPRMSAHRLAAVDRGRD
jgi:hypothetical protein